MCSKKETLCKITRLQEKRNLSVLKRISFKKRKGGELQRNSEPKEKKMFKLIKKSLKII